MLVVGTFSNVFLSLIVSIILQGYLKLPVQKHEHIQSVDSRGNKCLLSTMLRVCRGGVALEKGGWVLSKLISVDMFRRLSLSLAVTVRISEVMLTLIVAEVRDANGEELRWVLS